MSAPLRVAVHAGILGKREDPFARLTSAALLNALSAEPDLKLDVFVPEDGPTAVGAHLRAPSATGLRAILFDQVRFPRAAGRLESDLLLYLHPSGPLAGPVPTACWYSDGGVRAWARRRSRIERAVALAGLRGAAAVFHPSDMPSESGGLRWVEAPPIVPAAVFGGASTPTSEPQLPESFVLAIGEPAVAVPLLLAAWTWVESSLGDSYALVFVAYGEYERARVQQEVDRMGLADTVRVLRLDERDWPHAFHRAAALLHAGEAEDAAALRWSLAASLPVAAVSTPVSQSILGPAGYLADPTARALGAACLTLLVEDSLAASLREQSRARAARYAPPAAASAWAEALRQISR